MAETTTTTSTAATPAGGEAQTTQQTATPTAEQRTAFQKFMDVLFGGKEDPAPGSGEGEGTKKDGDPAPKEGEGTKPEGKDGKSYSEADVEAKIAEAKAHGRLNSRRSSGWPSCPRRNGPRRRARPRSRS